jgi:hypothetical protein
MQHFKAESQIENPSSSSLLLLAEAVDTLRKDQLSFKTVSPLLKPTFPVVIPSSPITVVDQEADDNSQQRSKKERVAKFVQFRLNHVHYSKPTNGEEFNTPCSTSSTTEKVKILYRPIPLCIGRPLLVPPNLLSGMKAGEIRGC